MVLDLRVGDSLRLRRKHPCGSFDWDVVRVGADVGMVCRGCKRRVLIGRDVLRRRIRLVLDRGAEVDPAVWRALEGDGPSPGPESRGDGPSPGSESRGDGPSPGPEGAGAEVPPER